MGYTVEDLIKSNEFSGIKIINNFEYPQTTG